MKLVLFSRTAPCPYCDAAKQLLESHNLQFTEIVADSTTETKKYYREIFPTAKTVPQIFIEYDDEIDLIGGYQDLREKIFTVVGKTAGMLNE